MPAIPLADSAERIAKRAAEEAIARVKTNRKALGPRPPWTTRMTNNEKLALWMEYAMTGTWPEFLMMLESQGVPKGNAVLKEYIDFVNWGTAQLAKTNTEPPMPPIEGPANAYPA